MAASIRRILGRGLPFINRSYVQAPSVEAVVEPPHHYGEPVWHLYSAVCLERLPVVAPPLSPIEREFSTLLRRLEFENSLKSDHEMRHERDIATAEALRLSDGDDADLMDAASMQTAADFEDACAEELAAFTSAPMLTEADRAGDLRSTDRELAASLVLVVQQRLGTGAKWMMPQGRHQSGETMRQTAERTLQTVVGPDVRARFLGNVPWGFYKYKYPKALRRESGAIGGKVFFFKAVLSGGAVEPAADEVADYKWLTRGELRQQLLSSYYRSVHRFLVDED
ncbi:39S ribosomal protein L46, mitochondrial-like [Pollicipes pollicipes]|uniref:39S ribosomal protein L46, mitochondrial-like n=1 Tax=Pollicipes pollicipes TaxID=41117 RepID=UPI0018849BA1|nr:39S ribosomal protein L46, mitochondrial-like [Pollicipes pollicipes]